MKQRATLPWQRFQWLLCLALTMFVGVGSAMADSGPVLGAEGTMIRLLDGDYGEFFPEGKALPDDHPILVLETTATDGTIKRFIVPGTESRDPESSATLVLEESTQEVYLLWEQLFNGIHPFLRLISFDGENFSEPIEIVSGAFARKGSPKLLVTRHEARRGASVGDSEDAVSGPRTLEHTILHVTWWQEDTVGVSGKRYAPIVIENGRFEGPAPVVDLGLFAPPGDILDPVAPGLENLLSMHYGVDHRSGVIGFLDPGSHRVIGLRFEMISSALVDFADKARLEIVIVGHRARSRVDMAEELRKNLVQLGTGLHRATRAFLADAVADMVLEQEDDPLGSEESLANTADKARLEIVVIGSGIDEDGLEGTEGEKFFLDIGLDPDQGNSKHGVLLEVERIADLPVPALGFERDIHRAKLFLGDSGKNAVVAWDAGERIYYREMTASGEWSEDAWFDLSETLTREVIYGMFDARVNGP